jgi:hypothetical protein
MAGLRQLEFWEGALDGDDLGPQLLERGLRSRFGQSLNSVSAAHHRTLLYRTSRTLSQNLAITPKFN